jgi:hypothetical protein
VGTRIASTRGAAHSRSPLRALYGSAAARHVSHARMVPPRSRSLHVFRRPTHCDRRPPCTEACTAHRAHLLARATASGDKARVRVLARVDVRGSVRACAEMYGLGRGRVSMARNGEGREESLMMAADQLVRDTYRFDVHARVIKCRCRGCCCTGFTCGRPLRLAPPVYAATVCRGRV